MTRSRLDAPFGQWIDRSESVDIRFEGKTYSGFMGDTVASALIANQQWLLSRSFKYHRPRGPLTLCGHDANTLVQLPEAPNRLADELPISEHRVINAQNYSGSLERDRNQLLDSLGRFMPVGFYYKAFYKPFGSWRFWERIIRRKAGLGVANLTVEPRYTDKQYLFHDIAIIGGGPAGISAALTAAQAGASVLLIDDQPHLGGSLNYHRFDIDAAERAPTLNHLRTQILDNDNIRVLTSATCNGWFTDHYLPVLQGSRMYKVRAKACILASGSSEQHVVFRHNDLPGIALCSFMVALVLPGTVTRRCLSAALNGRSRCLAERSTIAKGWRRSSWIPDSDNPLKHCMQLRGDQVGGKCSLRKRAMLPPITAPIVASLSPTSTSAWVR